MKMFEIPKDELANHPKLNEAITDEFGDCYVEYTPYWNGKDGDDCVYLIQDHNTVAYCRFVCRNGEWVEWDDIPYDLEFVDSKP